MLIKSQNTSIAEVVMEGEKQLDKRKKVTLLKITTNCSEAFS